MEHRGITVWLDNTEGKKKRKDLDSFAVHPRQGSVYFLGSRDLKIPVWGENYQRKFL